MAEGIDSGSKFLDVNLTEKVTDWSFSIKKLLTKIIHERSSITLNEVIFTITYYLLLTAVRSRQK